MKRSTQVAAPLLATAAFSLLTGCRKPEMQRCVDENNNVVADSLCQNQPNAQQRPDGHGGFIPVIIPYRYYYGGWGSYNPGTHADGGAYVPTAGRSYTTRGGFGSFFGGGEGAGSGGHAGSAGA